MNKKLYSLPFALLIISLVPQAFSEYEDTIVIMETLEGRLIIEFFPDVAPNHVKNFVTLSNDGFYTGTIFHRIIEGFMVQGGDPKTAIPSVPQSQWGSGDPGYSIDAEFNKIEHKRGIVSMARSSDPNSAGSQFFIVHKDSNFLDGQYTVFGRILTDESFETLDKMATMKTDPDDRPMDAWRLIVENVQVLDRSELNDLPENVPPKLNEGIIETPQSQNHIFKEYGISFDSPAGWLVQTPPVTSSTAPQIAIVGTKSSSSMAAISIRVDQSLKDIDEHIDELRESISPLIENDVIVITGETKTSINNYDAYVIKAIGHFENQDEEEQRVGFASVMIREDNLLYTLQYTNLIESFDTQEIYFINFMNSMELFTPQPMETGIPDIEESQSESVTFRRMGR